jgi:uncharacterized protein DUF29
MDLSALYDDDIYAWSLHQGAVLRRMAAEGGARLPNDLDVGNVIEEIETVGRSEMAGVRSHLTRMLEHLIKAVPSPTAYPATKWMGEVAREQTAAIAGYTPSMRQNLDLARVWRDARRVAAADLAAYGEAAAALPEDCPFALEELLDPETAPEGFAAQLAATTVRRPTA